MCQNDVNSFFWFRILLAPPSFLRFLRMKGDLFPLFLWVLGLFCCGLSWRPFGCSFVEFDYSSCSYLFGLVYLDRAGCYEVFGYVYNYIETPKILMTGKWNESMSYQPCDSEGEPLPGTELKEYGKKVETTRETVIPELDYRIPIVFVQFIPNHGFKSFPISLSQIMCL